MDQSRVSSYLPALFSKFVSIVCLITAPSMEQRSEITSGFAVGASYFLFIVVWMYGLANAALPVLRLDTYTTRHDYLGPIICGFTTGFVFKSTGMCAEEGG